MRKLLLVLFVALLTFAGCGDSADDSSDTAADETSESGSSTDTDFSGKGSGDFCDLARQYQKDFEDTDDAQTGADVEKEYKELASAIDKLVDEAPDEIEADAKKVNGAFKDLNALLAKYDYDFTKVPEDEAAAANLDDPEIEAASNRVESYFEKVCKIDSDDDGDTDGVVGDDATDPGTTSDEEQAPDDVTEDTADETTETTRG